MNKKNKRNKTVTAASPTEENKYFIIFSFMFISVSFQAHITENKNKKKELNRPIFYLEC